MKVKGRRAAWRLEPDLDSGTPKPERLSAHARGYLARRGFSEAEVEQAIRTRPWRPADLGRLQCDLDVPFGRDWNGRRYATKRVRPVFVQDEDEIVVVTVYTFYF